MTCRAEEVEFDHACIAREDYEKLAPVSDYLGKHTFPRDRILVFPYENLYGDVSRRIVSGGVLQAYAAASPYLVMRDLQGIEADQPPVAIYSAEGLATAPIDSVPNFTRSPERWFYLQSHYQQETDIRPGILALRSSDERRHRWSMRATPLRFDSSVKQIRIHKSIRIGTAFHCPSDMDFLRLRLVVHYPFWWRLSKPSYAFIEILREEGSYSRFAVLISPNEPSEIWIFPWNNQYLSHYFASSAEAWRLGERPSVRELRLRFDAMDFMSAAPITMTVGDLSAITLTLK